MRPARRPRRPIGAELMPASPDSAGSPPADWRAAVATRLADLGYPAVRYLTRGDAAWVHVAAGPTGGPVAIRVSDPLLATGREAATLRNWLALKLAVRLLPRHPNLVRFRDAGSIAVSAGGRRARLLYTVLDYVEGSSLLDCLRAGAVRAGGVARLAGITLDILAGWAALHRRGLRKGDLSRATSWSSGTRSAPCSSTCTSRRASSGRQSASGSSAARCARS
jgi:hypothetical protein